MRRIAVMVIALLCLCACSSGADNGAATASDTVSPTISEITYDDAALSSGKVDADGGGINLDMRKEGYTIAYYFDSSWESEEEINEGTRFTHMLLTNDVHQQDLIIVAEISSPDVESLHEADTRRQFLDSEYIKDGLEIERTDDVYFAGDKKICGLSIDFTQASGNVKMDGIMYAIPWKGYTYAFAYISSNEVGDAQRDIIYSMLNSIEYI